MTQDNKTDWTGATQSDILKDLDNAYELFKQKPMVDAFEAVVVGDNMYKYIMLQDRLSKFGSKYLPDETSMVCFTYRNIKKKPIARFLIWMLEKLCKVHLVGDRP